MTMEFGEDLIRAVWSHMHTKNQITDDRFKNRLAEITTLYRLINCLKRSKNPSSMLDQINCSDNDKKLLLLLIESQPTCKQNISEWNINVIVSNDCIYKSLHPKVQLNINNGFIEMNSEQLSELRYDVAKMLHRMQHYMY